jgi:hypothetical protein
MKRRPATEQQVSRIDPIDDEELVEESEVREEIGATIAALMPWGISILAHVALIVIAFFLVWQTIVTDPTPPVIPTLTSSPEVPAPLPKTDDLKEEPPAGGPPTVPMIPEVTPVNVPTPGFDLPPVNIQVPHDSTGIKGKGFVGEGIHDGGDIGIVPPGSVKEVVFLIDASGSMIDVLPFVINELKRVVNELPADRVATVIFFSGKGVHEVPGGGGVKGLRQMTPAFKTQVREWVALENFNYDIGGRGSAHVKSAITRALSYKPELVILLSDNLTGGGQGATQHELMQDDLIDLINKSNKANPPTKINTIQFLYEDPLVRHGLQGSLARIAKETGGKFRFISQRELDLR